MRSGVQVAELDKGEALAAGDLLAEPGSLSDGWNGWPGQAVPIGVRGQGCVRRNGGGTDAGPGEQRVGYTDELAGVGAGGPGVSSG